MRVFTSDRESESLGRFCPSENQNRSRKRSHKRDGIGVRTISEVSIFFQLRLRLRCLSSAYDLAKTILSESEAEAVG